MTIAPPRCYETTCRPWPTMEAVPWLLGHLLPRDLDGPKPEGGILLSLERLTKPLLQDNESGGSRPKSSCAARTRSVGAHRAKTLPFRCQLDLCCGSGT